MESVTPESGAKGEAEPQKARPAEAIVRCKGFRCAAYRDEKGAWRAVADDSQLEVLEVLVRF